ncbi:MAG: hypothetical protein GY856_29065, partial [bacterium]|nr:hypothetical protein [bacterium]
SGTVDWRVTREPVFPRWWWWFGRPTAPVQTIAAGTAELDADGKFRITFTPAADERRAAKQMSYRYRLSADVTDEGGETRSASRSFRLGFVAVEAVIQSDVEFLRRGARAELTIRRSDLDGVGRAGRGEWRVVALAQPPAALLPADQPLPKRPDADPDAFRTPGDELRPRWDPGYSPRNVLREWDDGARRAAGTVDHDEQGEAKLRLPDLPAGAYRLHYTTEDDFGAGFETSKELLVVGDEPGKKPLALPGILLAERASVAVGGTARLLVHSGLADQEMVLEIFRGGRRVERRLFESRRGPRVVEIAVGEEHRGGFGVTLTCLRDHQLIHLNDRVLVPWDDRKLKIEFITFRDRLRPGAKESWQLRVTGADERVLGPGMAELLAYMYDRSLDIFAPHQPVDPITLYPDRTATPGVGTSLGTAREAWRLARDFAPVPGYPSLRPDRLKFYEGYGIGGPGRGRRGLAKGRELMVARMEVADASALPAAPTAVAEAEPMVGALAEGRVSAKAAAPPPGEPPPPETPEEPLRSDFAETAFWMPQLLSAKDGTVTLDFSVPDSVTEWNVWVHALTRDLRSGSLKRQARSVKELMVRPYLPRFLREGDRAELKVVVNNASEEELRGTLDFNVLDAETEESLLAEFGLSEADASGVAFSVAAGGGTDLSFPVRVPNRVGTVAFRVVARSGGHSDGELRPLPVLPGRVHLAQSRFAALRDRDRRTLHFADLAADDDPTRIHEQLVVTLDAQLFYSVLNALPYLVNFPYECTEQNLNRFVSTGILSGLYAEYPAVARMAKQLSERTSPLESFKADDPNRKMALEETPWLVASRGGKAPEGDAELINVLDPKIAAAHRDAALAELRKAQTSLGAFPWWPGGPPSPYMTLYILYGFSKGLEFGVEVPQDMVVKAWGYMHRHYLDELTRAMIKKDCCWEVVTFLNYVLSSYPDSAWTGEVFTDDEREKMLAFSFGHWRRHSPLLKGYLALTLRRAGRTDDARLVFASVMDSAKTTPDQGTFWAPEDRAWLWYNDTIETHAFALRTLSELEPSDARRHGLVQWLFLNKKLNHWKSTRATAEVIYSLVHYLEQVGALGVREEVAVAVGPRTRSFVFEPDRYTGRNNQMVIAGDEIDPATMATVEVSSESPGFLFASATWHFSTEELPAEARGDFFSVTRRYFRRVSTGREWVLQPLAEGAVLVPGDQVEVQLSLRTKHAAEYVHLRDPRGAGFEPETTASQFKWDLGIGWYEEVRDSGTNFFFEWLPVGEYTFKYRLRANLAGTFRVGPATIQSMYAPEFT